MKTIDELKREACGVVTKGRNCVESGLVAMEVINWLNSQGHLRTRPEGIYIDGVFHTLPIEKKFKFGKYLLEIDRGDGCS